MPHVGTEGMRDKTLLSEWDATKISQEEERKAGMAASTACEMRGLNVVEKSGVIGTGSWHVTGP